MRNLDFKRQRFLSTTDNYSSLYYYSDQREKLTKTAGILNFLWNNWNNFWRDFWIAYISGGYDLKRNPIIPLFPSYTDKQSCYYLLSLCGKRKSSPGATIVGNYNEPTWGDPTNIIKIASILAPNFPYMTYVLGVLSHYQIQIIHLQKIRNSFIHLNNENIFNLNSLASYYTFNADQKIIDILEAKYLGTDIRCIDNIVDNLKGMIINL